MRKKKFFIIMLGLVLTISLLVVGCGADDTNEEDIVGKDDDVVVAVEDEETGQDEEANEDNNAPKDEVDNDYDIEVGKLAPNFTLENLNGEEISLEDYRGKIIMLNFWATWCPYCVKEMPDMDKLQKENDDLVILAVNVKEEKKIAKDYIEEAGYDFEVVLDLKGDVTETYLVGPIPTSYFIDKEGILLGGVPGMLEYPQMVQLIEGIREDE